MKTRLILWVMGLVTAVLLSSHHKAIGDDNPWTGTIDTGTVKVSLSGHVYYDVNHNGELSDTCDWALGGVGISLYSSNNPDTPVATTTADKCGKYIFSDIGPGTYDIRCTTPGNWTPIIGDITGISGAANAKSLETLPYVEEWGMENIVLNAGDQATSFDFSASNFPIQLLSKRLLLASSKQQLVLAVPEPSTMVMLIAAAITIGLGAVGRRYFNK